MVKYLLSCDGGGGIRAIVAAQFLAEMEKDFSLVLHERFDLFAGANTGALTALAIATEQLTAKDVIERLFTAENAGKIMQPGDWHKMTGLVQARPRYAGQPKTAFLKQKFSTMKIHSAPKASPSFLLLFFPLHFPLLPPLLSSFSSFFSSFLFSWHDRSFGLVVWNSQFRPVFFKVKSNANIN